MSFHVSNLTNLSENLQICFGMLFPVSRSASENSSGNVIMGIFPHDASCFSRFRVARIGGSFAEGQAIQASSYKISSKRQPFGVQ